MLVAETHPHHRSHLPLTRSIRSLHHAGLERLEERVLLSSTLFVTPVTPDATHFHTLQEALAAAVAGDTLVLQSGFSMGTFSTTHLSLDAVAGTNTLRTTDPLSIGEVISIGANTLSDTLERALVTGVSATGSGDYLFILATGLKNNHSGSVVDATNATSIGPTIGLWKAITLTADSGVVMPFSVDIWKGTSGAALRRLNLTSGPATSVWVEGDNNTLTGLTIGNQLVLTDAHGNQMSGLTVGNRVFVDAGSSGNTITTSILHQIKLQPGSHANTFTSSTIAGVVALGDNSSSGGDVFFNNTFTGAVTIQGNLLAATNDVFSGNTFTVGNGDALTLLNADGTLVKGNTFAVSANYSRALVVGDSRGVVIDGNHAMVASGTGIYAYSDQGYTTSVDITNNSLATTDGFGIYLAKWDSTAGFEARVQGNDLRNNAVGVKVYGDGSSAGNIDLGGGATAFGSSTGNNDFSTLVTPDDWHYAIGLAGTDAAFTIMANANKWAVKDPMTVVADGSHDPAAGGTGVIVATVAAPQDTLTLTANSLGVVQSGSTSGVVAHFTSNLTHAAGDFTATIAWGDGTTSIGTAVANTAGGFDILAARSWNTPGTFAMKVTLNSSAGGTAESGATVSVTSRVLTAVGANLSVDKGSTFTGVVGTFTDNLPGTSASSYLVTVRWSDGVVTSGTVTRNPDGSFSISTTRTFSAMGALTATVSIQTLDDLFSTSTSSTMAVTTKNGKVPPGKLK